jgi:hypothetical protein
MLLESDEETTTSLMLFIQYTLLLAAVLFMGVTSWKFIQLRHHSIIRCRSLPLTMFTTVIGAAYSIFVFGTTPFFFKLPCSILFWTGCTLIPLYAASICAMAIRLSGEYYVGRAAITVLDRRLRKCSQVASPLPFASHACDSLFAPSVPTSPISPLSNQALMLPSRNSINVATSTDNWLLSHRYLFSVRSMFYGMAIYQAIIVILGIIGRFYINTDNLSSFLVYNHCPYFDWNPLLCICLIGFILILLMPCLLLTLRKVNDTYSIRRGLVLVLLCSMLGLIGYITLRYTIHINEYNGFRLAHVLIPMILFNHIVLICWPLYILRNALPHRCQTQGSNISRSRSNNSNIECGYLETKFGMQYDTSYISRDVFRQLLNDPARVDSVSLAI